MFTFFNNTGSIRHQLGTLTSVFKRSMHTMVSSFNLAPSQLSNNEQPLQGKLIRIGVTGKTVPRHLQTMVGEEIIKKHPNCLFIGTNPTRRMKDSLIEFHVGHSFAFVTGSDGKVVSSVSKRPNLKEVLEVRNCIPDPRFKNQQRSIRLYKPRYTTVEEDIQLWLNKAEEVPDYPLYFNILPLTPSLPIDAQTFKDNVDEIIEYDPIYALFDSVDPKDGRHVRGDNCISATERAIFGPGSRTAQGMFCQEAAMTFILRLLTGHQKKSTESYLSVVDEFGFNQGIEPPPACEENYRAAFTC